MHENASKIERRDHLIALCENNVLRERMFYQGIYEGKGYVHHFANNTKQKIMIMRSVKNAVLKEHIDMKTYISEA